MMTIEKYNLITIVAMLVISIGGMAYVFHKISDAGGVKEVIIDAGKEVKDIMREIAKD